MPEDKAEQSQSVEHGAEKKALSTHDAQAARTASAANVNEVQSTNPNKFESMTMLPTIKDGKSLEEHQQESFGINMGDSTAVTAKGIEASTKKEVSVDPHPSYVEGLKAIENDEEAQGKFSIEYMERKAIEALAALQKPPTEQVLIASNVTPVQPSLEQMQNFEDIQSDVQTEATIAWDPREWAGNQLKQAEKQTTKTVQNVGRAAKFGEATAKDPDLQVHEDPPKGGDYWHPHRGREDDFVSYPACAAANMPFENVRFRIGQGPGHIDNITKHWKDGDANGALILSFNPDQNQFEHVTKHLKIIKAAKEKSN